MKQIAFALVLIVAGAVTASLSADRILQGSNHVACCGWSLTGEVVAVDHTDVVVAYSLLQEERLGVARPHDPSSFAVGDLVTISVLDAATDRVVIRGGSEAAPLGVLMLLVSASLAVLFGIGMVLMRLVSTPVAGEYSRPEWRSERHGGA